MADKGMKICPACKGEAPEDIMNCPWCPYAWEENPAETFRPKKYGMASWPPAVWAAIAAVAMIVAWRGIEYVINQADPETKNGSLQGFVDKQRIVVEDKNGLEKVISDGGPQTEQKAKQVSGAPPSGAVTNAAWASGAVAPPSAKLAAPPPVEEAEDVQIGPGGPPPVEVKEWKLRGMVFNLVTLQPIPHCMVYFTDPKTHSRYETSTDGTGAYKTIVPSLTDAGYQVTFQKDGFAKSYLNPGAENVDKMAQDERKQTAVELSKTFDPPYEVQAAGAAPLVTNFYLAPLN